jgi:hypothetical protein
MLDAIHRWENEGGAVRPTEPGEERLATARAAGGAKRDHRPSPLPLRWTVAHGVGVVTREADRGPQRPNPTGLPRTARDLPCRG